MWSCGSGRIFWEEKARRGKGQWAEVQDEEIEALEGDGCWNPMGAMKERGSDGKGR